MGYDELRVQRDALKRHAKGFDDGADKLKAILGRLEAALAAEGKCWGADETGKAFESKYAEAKKSAVESIKSMTKNLGKIEDGLRKTADNLGQAEEASGG